ncbi:RNA recognition motif domain [Dillenia turbinata]|uniref:RNA recognition motif domain n=1 Tax=Dillenia turbinata TaxID=194707 RepID=A0AAN8VIV1_9MAGN
MEGEGVNHYQQHWAHQQIQSTWGAPASATTTATYHQPATLEEVRTLWIGDLQYWVDESYLQSCFAHTGDRLLFDPNVIKMVFTDVAKQVKDALNAMEVLSTKIIRNKITGQPEGYGFVEFVSHAAAERILQTYNGTQMPGTEQTFRLNWASFGVGERRPDAGPEHSIFVGDLAPDVTDYLLQETFRAQYSSVRGAKVVTDPNTGRSKGYGFVKFSDETERNRAMTEMNGVYCSTRPMRISAATPKKTTGFQQQYVATKGRPRKSAPGLALRAKIFVQAWSHWVGWAAQAMLDPVAIYPAPAYTTTPVQAIPPDSDLTNTTVIQIFIGGLDPNITEEELRQIFLQFGEIVDVKIPANRGFGVVQFGTRASAEEAIQRMQGTMIGPQVVRISWGRSPTAKQDIPGSWFEDPNQWSSAYYGYGQGYDAYAYGSTQDPSLYAYGAYAGYYHQQIEGMQEMTTMTGAISTMVQKDELYDPLATPDVDKLNAAYLAVHGSAILGRPLWLKTSSLSQQA